MHDQLGTVLVTGGASGLGRAVAQAVEKGGGRPLVVDLAEPTDDFDHVTVDLVRTRETERAVDELARRNGGLDAVVTAAATDVPSDFEELDGDTWDRVVQVNLLGTAAVLRASLPWLRQSEHPRIVTVASTLGLRALPAATAYAASKFGVVGFTRALTLELAGEIGVTMLVPGGMDTSFFDGRPEEFAPASDQLLNDPAHVADTVVFALRQPGHCEIREMIVTPAVEPSWP